MAAVAQPLDADERLARLRLARTGRIGPVAFRQLLERFGSAVAALAALPELTGRHGSRLALASTAAIEREIAATNRLPGRLLVLGDDAYPSTLAAIEDAPPVLAIRGEASLLQRRCVAVVGARNASLNAVRFAEQLAAGLAAAGLVIVSGLARGIDAAAHRGAEPHRTVAVLAGGVDNIYPRQNAGLYDAIASSGAVISEMPLGLSPQAGHFPRRNRIISGLSIAVVVVEASERSGSLITARFAADQGRDVLAVPGFPGDPRAAGPNRLIRDGATLVTDAADVLEALGAPLQAMVPRPADGHDDGPIESRKMLEIESDSAARAILSRLGPTPSSVDELVRQCHLSAPLVATILLELELAGRVTRHPGNQVSLLL